MASDAAPGEEVSSALGRRHRTTRRAIEQAAFVLFSENGFDETTVDDIARAASIGRRTFFRYFASKNDIAWGDFDVELARLEEELDKTSTSLPILEAIRIGITQANRYPLADLPALRQRLTLLVQVPALRAHAVVRYGDWQNVVSRFAARRLERGVEELVPQAIGRAVLGVALASYTCWIEHSGTDLEIWLDEGLGELAAGFQSPQGAVPDGKPPAPPTGSR